MGAGSRWLACLLLGALLALAAMPARSGVETEQFRPAAPGYVYQFPRDHGAHDEFRTEWWYYTGHLVAADGRRFGYQLTFFRRGVARRSVRENPSRWAVRHLYLAHFALSDIAGRRFRWAEKISRAGIGKAGAEAGRLHVWTDRWLTEDEAGRHHLKAEAAGFAIDLLLTPGKPPVIHGTEGVSRKGAQPGQASHYYSLTRLETAGTVTVEGRTLPVTGSSWMDHEFGSADLGEDLVGWDWYSVQLDDRTELMFYRLRRKDGSADPASSGTVVWADGRSQHLAAGDVQVEALDTWTSPRSGARYPSRWRLSGPGLALSLELTPLLADQELVTSGSTQVTYWEGAVGVSGRAGGAAASGRGYVELTGYAARFRERL